ncbi:MAG: iron-containing alcohol dehydrogenase [Candidatus Fimivivens sp.]
MYTGAKLKVALVKPVMSMLRMRVPKTFVGPGTLAEIPEIFKSRDAKKAFILASNTVTKSGMLDQLLKQLDEAQISYRIFNGVKPDPTFDIIDDALAQCNDPDMVLAIGGGSVLDTAKAVAAAITNGGDAKKLVGMLKVKKPPVPMIFVPTTAGTGSEATIAAIISDDKTHLKKQILDTKIIPEFAVFDPNLMLGLPAHTRATTVMDALTHALEAYVSTYARPETDKFAETAIKLIYENLPLALREPDNLKALENLLVASFYAGQAFTKVYIGYVHAFSHAIGGKYGVSHGLGNAVLLPHVMAFYKETCADRFAHLAELLNLEVQGSDNSSKAQAFVDSLFLLNQNSDIPSRLADFPASSIEQIIDLAFQEAHGTYPVPRYYTRQEAHMLLEKICAES